MMADIQLLVYYMAGMGAEGEILSQDGILKSRTQWIGDDEDDDDGK